MHWQYTKDVRVQRNVRRWCLQLRAHGYELSVRLQRLDLQPGPVCGRDVQFASCGGLLRRLDPARLLESRNVFGRRVQLFLPELRLQQPASCVLHGEHRAGVRRRFLQRRFV